MMALIQLTKDNSGKFEQFQQENAIMAFVNELIPEEQKDKFPFPVQIGYDGSKPTLYMWTIDRERDVFLVRVREVGGGYEGTPVTTHFIMSWHGNLISIAADRVGVTEDENGVVLTWRVHRLVIPPGLQEQREAVVSLIKEAFATMGDIYDGEQYAAVNIDFKITSTC